MTTSNYCRLPPGNEIRRIVLDRLEFHSQAHLPACVYRTADVSLDLALEQLVVRLSVEIAGEKLRDVSVTYPSTWRDSLLDRFLPKWLRKYVPISYRSVRLRAAALYPTIPVPGHSPVIYLESTTTEELDPCDY